MTERRTYDLVIDEPDTYYTTAHVASLYARPFHDPHNGGPEGQDVEVVNARGEGEPKQGGWPRIRVTVRPLEAS